MLNMSTGVYTKLQTLVLQISPTSVIGQLAGSIFLFYIFLHIRYIRQSLIKEKGMTLSVEYVNALMGG